MPRGPDKGKPARGNAAKIRLECGIRLLIRSGGKCFHVAGRLGTQPAWRRFATIVVAKSARGFANARFGFTAIIVRRRMYWHTNLWAGLAGVIVGTSLHRRADAPGSEARKELIRLASIHRRRC